MKFILASNSPRRKELLEKLDIEFDIIPANINEEIDKSKDIYDEITRLAFEKANSVFENKNTCVIAADTMVIVNGEILGKPSSKEQAREYLKLLSGKTHIVVTAVCICVEERCHQICDKTFVTFKNLDNEEINKYVDSLEPMDKAGAYAIQGKAAKFIVSIEGDYSSVMGLPIQQVYSFLHEFKYI